MQRGILEVQVPLSEREQKLLDQIEQALTVEDTKFASRMVAVGAYGFHSRRHPRVLNRSRERFRTRVSGGRTHRSVSRSFNDFFVQRPEE